MAVDLNIPILIVDDHHTMIKIIASLLRQLGFQNIEEATNGEAAIHKLHSRNFALVISDWNMGHMTGIDLLKKIRSERKLHDLPFIMVTSESKAENVLEAKKAGVSNYIVKPFNALTLKAKLVQVLGEF